MPKITRSMSVGYSFDQVFDLVSDVRSYPQFVKWVRAMRVSDGTDIDGKRTFVARAAVGFRGFSETFTTKVAIDRENGVVTAELVKGPFKRLETTWRMRAVGETKCDFDLVIDYAFSNTLLQFAASANEDLAARRITESFIAEAGRRYGPQLSA